MFQVDIAVGEFKCITGERNQASGEGLFYVEII